jgi:hypothetical protein
LKARLGIALVLCASLLAPAVGHAAWSADPATVHATTDACPLVAAASDAQDGAIVVWQQNDAASPGVFRLLAKRLLANGEADASWPAAGALVSSMESVNRLALGALGDGGGGAYVWWMEYASLFLTRILSDGTIAPGWPVRGKSVGILPSTAFRPLVFADGQGGIWLGWLAGSPSSRLGHVKHLGLNGLGAGGWPTSGRSYAVSSPDEGGLRTLAFTYAPAADGGAWVAWGDALNDGAGLLAGSWRLKRVTATGLTAPGWDAAGLPVRVFHGELLVDQPYFGDFGDFAAALVAVAPDGADGAYLLLSDVFGEVGLGAEFQPKLFHFNAAGLPDPSWPAAGVNPHPGLAAFDLSAANADYSLRLFPEAEGGVFALCPHAYGSWSTFGGVTLHRVTAAGTPTDWPTAWNARNLHLPFGLEAIVPPSGDTYVASYFPTGPTGPYSPYAYIHVSQTYASGAKGPGFDEGYGQAGGITYYGDVGLAPTSNAGAIFAWSQVYERHGVFAVRLTPDGQVTAVEPGAVVAQELRLHFAPGRGVVATLGAVAAGRIQLLDVAGRVCAGTEVPAGAREVTIEGTATLAPGLYFARHRGADGAIETGRVVIVR